MYIHTEDKLKAKNAFALIKYALFFCIRLNLLIQWHTYCSQYRDSVSSLTQTHFLPYCVHSAQSCVCVTKRS